MSLGAPVPCRERWVKPRYLGQGPNVLAPGTELVIPRAAATILMLGAEVPVKNEGTTTARLQIEGAAESPIEIHASVLAHDAEQAPQTDNSYALEPGVEYRVAVRAGRSLREWISPPSSPVDVDLVFTDSARTVRDEWSFELSGPVVGQVAGDDSHWQVVAQTPIQVSLASTGRSYTAE